jgi:hypothetical protein
VLQIVYVFVVGCKIPLRTHLFDGVVTSKGYAISLKSYLLAYTTISPKAPARNGLTADARASKSVSVWRRVH